MEIIGDYRYRPQWKKAFRSYPNYIGSRVTYSRECKRSRIYTHFYNSVEKVLMQIITRVLCEDGSATWWDWVLRKSRICSFGLKVAKVPYYYCALKALSIFACSMNLNWIYLLLSFVQFFLYTSTYTCYQSIYTLLVHSTCFHNNIGPIDQLSPLLWCIVWSYNKANTSDMPQLFLQYYC